LKESALIQAKSNSFHPRKLLSMPLLNLKLHPKRRKTLADLEKLIEAQQATISSIEATLRLQGRCFLRTHEKVEDIEKDSKKLDKRLSALEPPKSKK
jgi:septal ring factor EnvC (AmiA/AmiB activator)